MTSPSKPALRLRVTAAAEKAARAGHPWIFGDSVREQNRDGQPGELAILYDRRDRFLAIGFFDPDSPIRVRILHAGEPETIDASWLNARIAAAFARRETMFDASTTGYRCANGESDGLPGLVADRYAGTVAVKLYTTAWLPWIGRLVFPNPNVTRTVLRLSRNIQRAAAERFHFRDGQILAGADVREPVVFLENGLRFECDPLRGQKTGFFLDQRENRQAVRRLASGLDLLNVFSFSGGFSLSSAAGGASSALSLDISEHALAAARRNFALNAEIAAVAQCRHETVQADAFEWLKEKANRKFGLAVLDPPSLAKRESEKEEALLAYGRLAAAALARLGPDGVLVACSCSAHVRAPEFFAAVRDAARKSGRAYEEIQTTGHAPDHAATFPEGEYLKAIYMRVR